MKNKYLPAPGVGTVMLARRRGLGGLLGARLFVRLGGLVIRYSWRGKKYPQITEAWDESWRLLSETYVIPKTQGFAEQAYTNATSEDVRTSGHSGIVLDYIEDATGLNVRACAPSRSQSHILIALRMHYMAVGPV